MLIPGHLATAAVVALGASRLSGQGATRSGMLLAAAVGGLTPDLLDKSRMVLGGAASGRTIGHSLLFLGLITVVWVLLRRRATVPSVAATLLGFWALGVASHLGADLVDDALRGWMGGGMIASTWFGWPWTPPYAHAVYASRAHLPQWPGRFTPAEIVAVLVAGFWLVRNFARRRSAPAA